FGRRQRERVRGRVQAVDKRPDRRQRADSTERTRGQGQEIAPGFAIMGVRNLRLRRLRHRTPRSNAADIPAAAPPGSYTVEEAELCDRLPHKSAARAGNLPL